MTVYRLTQTGAKVQECITFVENLIANPLLSKTGDYTIDQRINILAVKCSGADATITLPSVLDTDYTNEMTIVKNSDDAYDVILVPAATPVGQTINDASEYRLKVKGETVRIISDQLSNWVVTGKV